MRIKKWDKFFIAQVVYNLKVYCICFGFHSHLEKYINKVFGTNIFIFKNMGIHGMS